MAKKDIAADMRSNVIRLFGNEPVLPEMPLGSSPQEASRPDVQSPVEAVNLADKPKVIMAFGAGSTGKSTLIRWQADRARQRDDGETVAVATLDVGRPTLRLFCQDAMAPNSHAEMQVFLEQLLGYVMVNRINTLIDFPADATLLPLLLRMPNLYEAMRDVGIEPVVLFTLSPREADLSVAAMMEPAFKAPATALILNLGRTISTEDGCWSEFAKLRRHSAYRQMLDRGAVEIWMPRLYAAEPVEQRRIAFSQAVSGQGVDPRYPLSIFDVYRVKAWLDLMETGFAPVRSWLL